VSIDILAFSAMVFMWTKTTQTVWKPVEDSQPVRAVFAAEKYK
jgi:hypothetical protein